MNISEIYYLQDRIIEALTEEMEKSRGLLYLSGGTALTRFYLKDSRFSEDLDFFYDLSGENWNRWLSVLSNKSLFVTVIGSLQEHDRANVLSVIVSHENINVRVDFIEDFFSGMWLPQRTKAEWGEFFIDQRDAIRHKKLFSLQSALKQKSTVRAKDVFDLLLICSFRWNDMVDFYRSHRELAGFDFNAIRDTLVNYDDFQGLYLPNGEKIAYSDKAQRDIEKWKKSIQ